MVRSRAVGPTTGYNTVWCMICTGRLSTPLGGWSDAIRQGLTRDTQTMPLKVRDAIKLVKAEGWVLTRTKVAIDSSRTRPGRVS